MSKMVTDREFTDAMEENGALIIVFFLLALAYSILGTWTFAYLLDIELQFTLFPTVLALIGALAVGTRFWVLFLLALAFAVLGAYLLDMKLHFSLFPTVFSLIGALVVGKRFCQNSNKIQAYHDQQKPEKG